MDREAREVKVVRSGTTACFKEKELKSNDIPDPSEIGIYIVAPVYSYVMYYKKNCSEVVDRQNRIKDVTCSPLLTCLFKGRNFHISPGHTRK